MMLGSSLQGWESGHEPHKRVRDSNAQAENNESVLGIVPSLSCVIPVIKHLNDRTNKADQQCHSGNDF
jgi:hypothetical protein